jgi:hypothetical protein
VQGLDEDTGRLRRGGRRRDPQASYEMAYGPELVFDVRASAGAIRDGVTIMLDAILGQGVGMFGYAEVQMPALVTSRGGCWLEASSGAL